MEAILISSKTLEALFEETLNKLKLTQLSGGRNSNMPATEQEIFYTDNIHRKFHYEVCRLKDKLKEATI